MRITVGRGMPVISASYGLKAAALAGRPKVQMIRYALRCPDGHVFDAWFRDSAASDSLLAGRQVACAVCGVTGVEKRTR